MATKVGNIQGPIGPQGVQGGSGPQGPAGPTAVSSDTGNIAILGSDSKILVPQSSIWSMRLRSFNTVGNPTFEVDQISNGNIVAAANGKIIDRWSPNKSGTCVISAGQQSVAAGINLPGTNFAITRSFLRVTLTTAEPTLAAGDFIRILQNVEGSQFRELQNDVHSLQMLVRSSVANLIIGICLTDPAGAYSYTNTLTLGAANTWALLTLPNIPLWPSGGNFVDMPGVGGYNLCITLACGSTYMSSANGSWQHAAFVGAVGQSNFAASPIGSTFDIGFIQHEPGVLCTTPIDCSLENNYRSCLRYYDKSWDLGTAIGTASDSGVCAAVYTPSSPFLPVNVRFPVPMAKDVTPIFYSRDGTTSSAVTFIGAGVKAINGTAAAGQKGMPYVTFSAAPSASADWAMFHYTVDTGW